jgi:hypothetical protein
MSIGYEPRHLLVRALGAPSPLYGTDAGPLAEVADFTQSVSVDSLGLPDESARELLSWSLTRPPGGFTARPALRKHVERGLELARAAGQGEVSVLGMRTSGLGP